MATTPKAKILLVEDDVNLGFVVKDNLEVSGYEVQLCEDGDLGWQQFKQHDFDICILDVMLPKQDGFTLARLIREQNDQVPIIFLTAKSQKEDKLSGFRAGADDYVTKPFSIEELLLRIEVFLRRTAQKSGAKSVYKLGSYTFDYSNLSLQSSSSEITLTQKEADVLKLFCQNPDTILKREDILKQVWGDDGYFTGRSMDVFISRLRKYLKDDPAIEILNMHGIGFKLVVKGNQ